jgi:poly [ADP-ribose] polymerase 2/3/4
MDLASAIKEYNKTFKQKTSKVKGYSALEMSSGGDDKKITVASRGDMNAMEPSKLEPAVQGLMTFIHDKDAMEKSVIKAGYDISKLPLGKLSDETIMEGYKYLSQIEVLLKSVGRNDDSCKPLSSDKKAKVFALSSKFYTFIPHNFGFSKMANHAIDTLKKVEEKTDLVSSLSDMIKHFKSKMANTIDVNYDALKCKIKTIAPGK